jgi:hypothetical protein
MAENENKPGEPMKAGVIILIVVLVLYLVLLSGLLVYGLVQVWPTADAVQSEGAGAASGKINYLFWTLSVSDEVRMILIVALSGALGGLVHAIRSVFWYAGNGMLRWRWFSMYVLLPFVGSILGLIFYLVIRGGFLPGGTVEQASHYGFAALSALVGMFSQQAALKLRKIFETLLTEAPQGADAKPQE